MTGRTIYGDMGPCQREFRLRRVIECRTGPGRGCVTGGAVLRKSGRGVIRVGCSVEICQMARGTFGRQAGKNVVLVAVRARNADMRPREWELRVRIVVKLCPQPLSGIVTERAILRETHRRVVWTLRTVEIRNVAGNTICRDRSQLAIHVTAGTLCLCVCSSQREPREGTMVKFRALPAEGIVTDRTVIRKPTGYVIGVLGRRELFDVTG
jgi:hypothetical protein